MPKDQAGLDATRESAADARDYSEAVLAALLDSVDCGVLLFGSAGEWRVANDRFLEMLRIERGSLDEWAGFETLVSRLAPQFADSEAVAARWRERFESGEALWDELELSQPERKVFARFARSVRDRQGRRLGWLEIYRDITSQRLIETRLFHTERMAAIGRLVSGIAHELNNPLTSIVGYAQLLLTGRARAGREDDARLILQEAERASRIAKNLLLFARETERERSRVDLNEVVERALALRRYELRMENIRVEMDLDARRPATLGDVSQLQQVLLNLIVNAEQAIGQNHSQQGHIWLSTRRVSPDRVAFAVADDGPGIAPGIAARIFDPFFTTKPPGVGTGLGLSIVGGIVKDHGGEVSVQSRPGGGALFTVELPVAAAPAAGAPEKSWPRAAPAACSGGRPQTRVRSHRARILVVEDEPTVARLIADVLSEEGHPVETVLDSRKGLDRIRQEVYDLVICDLRLPHLDGRGFYRELVRQRSPLQHRLVFVTGDTLAPHVVEFLESSGMPYLAKPFLVEELKEVVHSALAAVGNRVPSVTRGSARWAQRARKRS